MTLNLDERVAIKLEAKAAELAQTLGFEVSHEQTLAYLLRDMPETRRRSDIISGMTAAAQDAMDAVVAEFVKNGNQKINAIKHVREKSGLGLKEAKDYVERKWPNVTC